MSKARINPQTGKAYRAKSSCDPLKMKWVSENGSIFTEEVVESKGESNVFVLARISIAFNVTAEIADQIVAEHNMWLNFQEETKRLNAEMDAAIGDGL